MKVSWKYPHTVLRCTLVYILSLFSLTHSHSHSNVIFWFICIIFLYFAWMYRVYSFHMIIQKVSFQGGSVAKICGFSFKCNQAKQAIIQMHQFVSIKTSFHVTAVEQKLGSINWKLNLENFDNLYDSYFTHQSRASFQTPFNTSHKVTKKLKIFAKTIANTWKNF